MLKKKKTTASGKLVLVKSVRRTRSHRMKFCVQRGLGALPSTSKRRGKSQRDFLPCGPVCINTGIACLFSPKMKRTSERIVKFHSLAQFISNFSDNSVSSFTVSWEKVLNQMPGLQIVTPQSAEVFRDNKVDLPALNGSQHSL